MDLGHPAASADGGATPRALIACPRPANPPNGACLGALGSCLQKFAVLGARQPAAEGPCIAFPSLSGLSRLVRTRGRLLITPENSIAGAPQRPAGRAQLTSSFHRRREFMTASHPSDFEVCLYAALLANCALRDVKKPSNPADEAALVQRVDAAIADFQGSLSSLGLRRKSNRSSAAAELDDVVQVMRDPEDLLSRQGMCRTLSGCPSSAWPLQHFAFSTTELFDFLHRQLQPKNPFCRQDRFRWKACKAEIGNLLKSGALFCIIEQLDAQQSPSPPERIEYEVALDELGVGSRLMDYNRLLGELGELGECANGPFV